MTRTVSKPAGAETIGRLVDWLKKLGQRRPSHSDGLNRVDRLELEIDRIDPLAWLAVQPETDKIYWQDRDNGQSIASVGAADLVTAQHSDDLPRMMQRVAAVLSDAAPGTRYFGGFRFDTDLTESARDPVWESFPSARLVLPRFEMISDSDRHYLACNVFDRELGVPTLTKIINAAQQLRFDTPFVTTEAISFNSRCDRPDRRQWRRLISQALDLFAHNQSDKLVLARKTSLGVNGTPDPWLLLAKLREQSEHCFVFGFAPNQVAALIGASPERLYCRERDLILTEAIAGTRVRSNDARIDNSLAAELADSVKERREHELVVEGIMDGLDGVCENYSIIESRGPLRLQALQHLVSRIRGQLRPGVDELQIIAALHPTPAVGGFPAKQAITLLHGYEPFDRGWYAGPFGWLAKDSAEFAVAIRSALIHDKQIDLLAGAGIVDGSEPESEWDEIEDKIRPFLQLFDNEAR